MALQLQIVVWSLCLRVVYVTPAAAVLFTRIKLSFGSSGGAVMEPVYANIAELIAVEQTVSAALPMYSCCSPTMSSTV